MHRIPFVLVFSLLVAGDAAAGSRKSLVVAVDGLRADGVISVPTPNMDRLLDGTFGGGAYRGAFAYDAQTIQDAPTSSAYNHCSIMTGVSGATHGVNANSAAGLSVVDYGMHPHYLDTLEQADPTLNTAYFVTWTPDLAIVSGADYVVDSNDADNTTRVVQTMEGTLDDPAGDEGSWTRGTEPDAIFLFLDDVDGAGHGNGFGPEVQGYREQVVEVDGQIGSILDAIENRPTFASEQWQVVITSDHGGIGLGHGGLNPNSETIPFIVASPDVEQGFLVGDVRNMDAATTAIAHVLGAGAVPPHHEGAPRGMTIRPPAPADLNRDLVLHLDFNGDGGDRSGRGNDAVIGASSDVDPIFHAAGGVCGGHVEIVDAGGGANGASHLTLGQPADLAFAADQDFTISAWVRATGEQSGDSVIFGNKDWASGINVGTLLLANEGDGTAFGMNVSDGALRRDVEAIDFSTGDWWLITVAVDRDDTAVLFIGGPTGLVHVLADFAHDLGTVDSPLPWNIGQDGTGEYPFNLQADLDDLRVWRRALDLDEVQKLHAAGTGTCSLQLLRNAALTDLSPVTPALSSILPLDPVADRYRSVLPDEISIPLDPGPLVFYSLDAPGTLTLEKAPGGLRLAF